MKTPRVADFDPNPNKTKLNSPLDNFPAIEKSQDHSRLQTPSMVVPPVLPVPPKPQKRKIKQRHPFDIYEDQLEELRKLSMEDRMRGGIGSMSAMVREAIDTFVSKKRNK